jgi:uncharacterized protein (TIGR03067 family)
MNDAKLAHPELDQLTAFAQGRLGEAELIELSSHLSHCTECRDKVEATGDDTLVSLLRAADTEHDREGAKQEAMMSHAPVWDYQCEDARNPQEAVTLAVASSAPALPGLPPELVAHTRYRVQELLGVGGMGAVYKAEHLLMERPVALKLINHSLTSNPAMVERFRREVKTAAKLKHPNIVMAYDAETAGDSHFLVMEYVEGTSLSKLVAEKGRLPIHQACDYIRQAAVGLQHAHERGMVHRDIKPQNLMLTPDGHVKILDFGLARFAMEAAPTGALLTAPTTDAAPASGSQTSPDSLTQIGTVMGTPDYIAPEQARDAHTADIRADIYSLGCTLYDLLAGHAPFPEGTVLAKVMAHAERMPRPLTELRKDVPLALARVIERMMAKDPAKRYQTPAEVAAALAPFTVAAPAKPRWHWKAMVAAAALGAAIWLAGAIIYVQTDNGEFAIEVADDSIAVMVKDKGVKIKDQVSGREYWLKVGKQDVRTGNYEIVATELPDGVELSGGPIFSIKRGGRAVATAKLRSMSDKARLQGEWDLVKLDDGGGKADSTSFPRFTFTGNRMRISNFLGGDDEGRFDLDESAQPKQFTYISSASRLAYYAIYRFSGDALELHMSEFEEDRPTEFLDKGFSKKRGLFVLKRPSGSKPAKTDKELVQGTWKGIVGFGHGRTLPDDLVRQISITFIGDTMEVKQPIPGSGKGKFKLDSSSTPKRIIVDETEEDGKPVRMRMEGIYSLDGNTLRICMGNPAEGPITEFGQKAGEDITLRREATGTSVQDVRTDKQRLQGTWNVVAMQGDPSRQPPEAQLKEMLKQMKMTFEGVDFRSSGPGSKRDDGSFKLDDSTDPKQIVFVGDVDRIARWGIYRFDGDRLTLCMGEENDRPTEFKPDPRFPTRVVVVLERAPSAPVAQTDKERLQGTWLADSVELMEMRLPPDMVKRVRFVFSGGHLRATMPTGEVEQGTFKLDPTINPKEMDIIDKADQKGLFAIYRFDGDRLHVCLTQDKDRPTEFKSKLGTVRGMIVLRRAPPEEVGWTPLFNGRDLTGWQEAPAANNWKVVNNALAGLPTRTFSVLSTNKSDYQDFHLRAEAKLSSGGHAELLFRVQGGDKVWNNGYRVYLSQREQQKTGTLLFSGTPLAEMPQDVIKAGEWFPLELIVRGKRIIVRINGQTTADYTDQQNLPLASRLSLMIDPPATVSFRSLEIKELPAEQAVRRNPFGVPDVDDPDGGDVQAFAAKTKRTGGAEDQNAEQWVTQPTKGDQASLDGEWHGRWNFTQADIGRRWHYFKGTVQIKTIGERVYILGTDDTDMILIDTRHENGRLVGRFQGTKDRSHQGPCVLFIAAPDRLDGDVSVGIVPRGRLDFRRKLEEPKQTDLQKIQGTWKGGSASVQGQQIPDLVFKAIGPTITFAGNKVTWKASPTPEAKDLFGGALAKFSLDGVFSLDTSKTPKTIDLMVLGAGAKTPLGTPAPRALLGIYKLEGDSLELCIAIDPDHVEQRPTKFESVPGKFIAHVKLKRDTTKPEAPKGKLINSFGTGFKPITRDLTEDDGGWKIDVNKERVVRLYDIQPPLEDCLVTYRAKMKTALTKGKAYLEMWVRSPNGGEFFTRGMMNPLGGTTDWTVVEVPFILQKNEQPDLFKLCVHVEGQGTVWIKDLEMWQAPLPAEMKRPSTTVPSAGGKFGLLHALAAVQTGDGVAPDQKGWRIDAPRSRTASLARFSVQTGPVPADGYLLTYRAQMKASDLQGQAFLEMKAGEDGKQFSRGTTLPLTGTTDWASYETSVAVQKDEMPPDKFEFSVVIEGKGKVWIKDIELLRGPLPK